MPCFSPTDAEYRKHDRTQGHYGSLSSRELEAVICGFLRSGKVTMDDVDFAQVGVDRKWVEQWWADHQKKDDLKEQS